MGVDNSPSLSGFSPSHLIIILIASSALSSEISCLFSNNNYPIILIHGFLGWGREEMSDYHYWGGSHDFEAIFRSAGYTVFTVSVGPISPNWERAVETYYQIKGGQLDYGANHSQERGYSQKPEGKSFTGLYPQWDENHPVHIIGHSQGGQTAKMLDYLLKTAFNNEESVLLHDAHRGWIKSITTISTPHNGTTLVPIMLDIFPFALNLAPWFGGIENNSLDRLYNFDLEHWGLEKKPDESTNNYFKSSNVSSICLLIKFNSKDLIRSHVPQIPELQLIVSEYLQLIIHHHLIRYTDFQLSLKLPYFPFIRMATSNGPRPEPTISICPG